MLSLKAHRLVVVGGGANLRQKYRGVPRDAADGSSFECRGRRRPGRGGLYAATAAPSFINEEIDARVVALLSGRDCRRGGRDAVARVLCQVWYGGGLCGGVPRRYFY